MPQFCCTARFDCAVGYIPVVFMGRPAGRPTKNRKSGPWAGPRPTKFRKSAHGRPRPTKIFRPRPGPRPTLFSVGRPVGLGGPWAVGRPAGLFSAHGLFLALDFICS